MSYIGFTGTREGMTQQQKDSVTALVFAGNLCVEGFDAEPLTFVHGDCIGADADFHEIVSAADNSIVIFPPEKNDKRAFCEGAFVKEPGEYLKRDRDIVEYVRYMGFMLACPKEKPTDGSRVTGGTWYTVNYAMSKGVPVVAVWPNGAIEVLKNVATS